MPKYLLTIIYPPNSTQPGPAEMEEIMKNVNSLHDELTAAGAWVFGGALHLSDAITVVRPQGDDVLLPTAPSAKARNKSAACPSFRLTILMTHSNGHARLLWQQRFPCRSRRFSQTLMSDV